MQALSANFCKRPDTRELTSFCPGRHLSCLDALNLEYRCIVSTVSASEIDDVPVATADMRALVIVLGLTGGEYVDACAESLKKQTHRKMQVAYVGEESAVTSEAAGAFRGARLAVDSIDDVGAVANALIDRMGSFDIVVFTRDDSILARDAIAQACETMRVTGAAVVGAKVVNARDPERLVEVGMSADRFGVMFSRLEDEELDQSQYDQGRQTLFVSFAFCAVRARVLTDLGGFDDVIEASSVELDFCWRVRVAGHDVVYTPNVRVAQVVTDDLHPERAAFAQQGRIRMMFKNYGWARWAAFGGWAFLLSMIQASASIFSGDYKGARFSLAQWSVVFGHPPTMFKARRQTQRLRKCRDGEISSFFVSGEAARLHANEDEQLGERVSRGAAAIYGRIGGIRMVLTLAFILFMLIAGRNLLAGNTPSFGGLLPPSGTAVEVLGTFVAPWRGAVDVGTSASAPGGLALTGLVGIVFVNSAAFAQKLLLILGLPLAAVVCSRSLRPTISSPGVRALSAAVYAFGPLWWNALAAGDLGVIVAAILLPTIVRRLAHITRLGAYAEKAPRRRRILELVLLIAVGTAAQPALIIAVGIVSVGWIFGSLLVGSAIPTARALVALLWAAIGAFVLLIPWSFTFLSPSGISSLIGVAPSGLTFNEIIRFDTGTFGVGYVGFGLVVGAFLPLMVARGTRFGWATRWWGVMILSFFVTWFVSRGWFPTLGSSEILLAPAVLAAAMLVGWGVDAIQQDLPTLTAGLRQPASFVLLAAVAVGLASPLTALPGGRFGQPDVDWRGSLAWQVDEAASSGDFRNLFVGGDVPGGTRGISGADHVRYAVAPPGGPTLEDLWLPPSSEGIEQLGSVAAAIASGSAPNGGRMLASFGVKYFVVPVGNDEIVSNAETVLDFKELQDDSSGTVYENLSWRPVASGYETPQSQDARSLLDLASVEPPTPVGDWRAIARGQWRGATAPDVYVAVPFSSRFNLETDAESQTPVGANGWALQFENPASGTGTVLYKAGPWRPIVIVIEVLLWLLVFSGLFGLRGRARGAVAG